MNISINITYTSGTKVELIVPLEEPHPLAEHKPEPVQPAADLTQAMEHVYKTSPTFPSNKDLEPTGKRYTSVREMVVDTCPEILDQFDGTTRNIHNMTFLTQDGKEYTVPPGLMRDLVTIYGEKTVEQELLKAHAWLEADVHRRKTMRGMGRFLNGWLSRASSMVRTPIKTLLKRDTLMASNGTQESW